MKFHTSWWMEVGSSGQPLSSKMGHRCPHGQQEHRDERHDEDGHKAHATPCCTHDWSQQTGRLKTLTGTGQTSTKFDTPEDIQGLPKAITADWSVRSKSTASPACSNKASKTVMRLHPFACLSIHSPMQIHSPKARNCVTPIIISVVWTVASKTIETLEPRVNVDQIGLKGSKSHGSKHSKNQQARPSPGRILSPG